MHRTSSAATVTDGAWNKLAAVSPPVLVGGVQARAFGAVSDSTNGTAGAMMWMAANNPAAITNAAAATQILGITFTSGFLTAPILTMPPDKTSVATNVGSQGTPTTFTWTSSGRAQCYDFQLALDKDFSQLLVDPINGVGACPVATAGVASNASLTIANSGTDSNTVTVTALVQGNTYWWRVRVRSIGLTSPGALGQGPWSQPSSFAVANQGALLSPQPQLPANGSTVLDLATTLRWNNPAGTVQHQLQVIPLNYDGPGIDLVISEPAMVAGASFDVLAPVMGQGNYVILPGATYNWRIRTTTKSGSLSPVDPSWGPWSAIWTFKTPRPNAASITLASVTPSATPTLTWRDIRASNFYYEVQLSQDKTFNNDPITATAAVYWNLVHGGVTTPLNSWTVPPGVSLEKGKTYWWRVRQRVQATELGAEELGVGWTAPASFIVP
ncbi:MAG: hypothetical protein NTZ05_04945 [Chloroflexi bacterium]|nr:hypothetical protein [Chloroflexota bacterium]